MSSQAEAFFEACETGKGWDACKSYCAPNATFSAQSAVLVGLNSLEHYVDWMKGLLTFVEGSYTVKAIAVDESRKSVVAYAVFHGVHTGEGGPVPATGKSVDADYVYVMQFEGDKIKHMTKIWNDVWTTKELGWEGR